MLIFLVIRALTIVPNALPWSAARPVMMAGIYQGQLVLQSAPPLLTKMMMIIPAILVRIQDASLVRLLALVPLVSAMNIFTVTSAMRNALMALMANDNMSKSSTKQQTKLNPHY